MPMASHNEKVPQYIVTVGDFRENIQNKEVFVELKNGEKIKGTAVGFKSNEAWPYRVQGIWLQVKTEGEGTAKLYQSLCEVANIVCEGPILEIQVG